VAEQLTDLEEENKAARQALVELEREVLRLRAKESGVSAKELAKTYKILPVELHELLKDDMEDDRMDGKPKGWLSNLTSVFQSEKPDNEAKQALATNAPGPAEKVLVQADKALEEKRRQREAENAESNDQKTTKK